MKLLLLFLMAATFALTSQTTFATFLKASDKSASIRVMNEKDGCDDDEEDDDSPE